jgi:16S rRNA A1518/A1519 N6-dimethyltransferase RsmA/KsgA/DIM1 with predicted DNA glycosylase/AP lyase activity
MPEEELLSFEKFLKTVFSHRRKKLRSNLRLSVTGAVFEKRAEELPPERLLELYRELREKGYLCLTT